MDKMNETGLSDEFLTYACSIFGDTSRGLTGEEIVRLSAEYALEFSKPIKHTEYPCEGKYLKRKEVMLKDNLKCFDNSEQVIILKSLKKTKKLPRC